MGSWRLTGKSAPKERPEERAKEESPDHEGQKTKARASLVGEVDD
jgi:hypothetical protein